MSFAFIPLDIDVIMRKMKGKSEEEQVKHYYHMGSYLGTSVLHDKVIEEVKNILSKSYVKINQLLKKL